MNQNEIEGFLQAIDRELAAEAEAGERLELFLLGRSALILRFGLNLATKDVDVVTRGEVPELQRRAFELFGKGSALARRWGLYLEAVPEGLPPVPGTYRAHAEALPGDWLVIQPRLLEVHDLAITKLKRFHAGDREDLEILCSGQSNTGPLTPAGLRQAMDAAYLFGMDEEEDPGCKQVNENLARVLDFLDGRTSQL